MKDLKEPVIYNGKLVDIMSCTKCNAKCEHCYISYGGNLTGDELYEMVDKLKDKYEIYINGSEPLMNKEYLKSYALANYESPITNGLVFYNKFDYIDTLKEYGITNLRISYHFDMHEEISPVPKSFLEQLFKEIKKRDVKLTIMSSLSKKNYKNIEKYCEMAKNFGADAIKFTNFISQGKAKKMDEDLFLDQSDYDLFFELLHKVRDKYDKNVLEIQRCGSFGKDTYGKSNFLCDAGVDFVCITPDKNVYPCIFFCQPGNEIGYYEDGKIYITKEFKNDQTNCLARKKYNETTDNLKTNK